jgi:hypothetical protein
MGSMHIHSGRVKVHIGDPIPTEGLKIANRAELNQRLYAEIAGMLGEPQIPQSVKIGE